MNRERVQMLRDMIAGIPEERIHLDAFYKTNGDPCGTIACIAGWAAIYPPFVAEGLTTETSTSGIKYVKYGMETCEEAAASFFGVDFRTFSPRKSTTGTDKQIALKRLDALLK